MHVNKRRPRERNVPQDTRETAWITPRGYPDDVDVLPFKRTRATTFPRRPTCTILSCPAQDDICPTPQRMIVYSQETDCADPRRGFSLYTLPVVSTANQTTGQWNMEACPPTHLFAFLPCPDACDEIESSLAISMFAMLFCAAKESSRKTFQQTTSEHPCGIRSVCSQRTLVDADFLLNVLSAPAPLPNPLHRSFYVVIHLGEYRDQQAVKTEPRTVSNTKIHQRRNLQAAPSSFIPQVPVFTLSLGRNFSAAPWQTLSSGRLEIAPPLLGGRPSEPVLLGFGRRVDPGMSDTCLLQSASAVVRVGLGQI